jgi:hypothetical protein
MTTMMKMVSNFDVRSVCLPKIYCKFKSIGKKIVNYVTFHFREITKYPPFGIGVKLHLQICTEERKEKESPLLFKRKY